MNTPRALVLLLTTLLAACGQGSGVDVTQTSDLGDSGTSGLQDAAGLLEDGAGDPQRPAAEVIGGSDDAGVPGSGAPDADGPGDASGAGGSFGAPCADNDECFSGHCIEGPDGGTCTKLCDSDCPSGWACRAVASAGDPTYICVPRHLTLCRPCTDAQDCEYPGFSSEVSCRDTGGGGSFCATSCDEDDCPEGYSCEQDGAAQLRCVPTSGVCECDEVARNQGLSTPCYDHNASGTCYGMMACGPQGLGACGAAEPAPEACDGKDNDCDGQTDEAVDFGDPDCQVADLLGVCAVGTWTCVDQAPTCVSTGQPGPELCNGVDDDCDGVVDEPGAAGCTTFYKVADEDDYGSSTQPLCLCAPAAPYTAAVDGDCDDAEPLAWPGALEVCDGADNDCDGIVDPPGVSGCVSYFLDADGDGFGNANQFFCYCGPTGSYATTDNSDCDDGEALSYPDATELCDGKDNDCDGRVDERANPQPTCPASCGSSADCAADCSLTQSCSTLCGSGSSSCVGGSWSTCTAVAPATCYDPGAACASYQTCGTCPEVDADVCDGVDEDCDGFTDEDATGQSTTCGVGVCEAAGQILCDGGAEVEVCTADAAAAGAEVCDGKDNDCDGLTDADDSDLTRPACELVEGVCAGAKMPPSACVDGSWPAVCPEGWLDESVSAYEADVETTCDGVDNDCDGDTDEDFVVALPDGSFPTGVGAPCGAGACAGGQVVCTSNGQGAWCSTGGAAAEESCNGVDDDCDGATDEGVQTPFFADTDHDGFGDPNVSLAACSAPDDFVLNDFDCDDSDGGAKPGAVEVCDGKDNDCDGDTDGLFETCNLGCADGQRACEDGSWGACEAPAPTSCQSYATCEYETICVQTCPEAPEEVCDGLDNDCDGATDEGLEALTCGLGTCAHTTPGCVAGAPQICDPFEGSAEEVCDGLDNDCDGATDEELGTLACGGGVCTKVIAACIDGTAQVCDPLEGSDQEACDGLDNDCDGQTDEDLGTTTCGQGQCTHTIANCQDGIIHGCDPDEGATDDTCDGLDNDCDGQTDEDLGTTTCGQGVCVHTVANCQDGVVQTCDPDEGATEDLCDGADNDCDGATDEDLGTLSCGQGVCAQTIAACIEGITQACDPLAGSGAEQCNGLDDDCNGQTDEDLGTTTCGQGVCVHTVANCQDGVTQSCDPNQGATDDTCDGLDNDCDGQTDEDLGTTTCGQGACVHTVANCQDGVTQSCDPNHGATEDLCDGADNDCDGATDEDLGTLSCGQGVCAQTIAACVSGSPQTCDPLAGAATEQCNSLDDDCDGQTDEDLGTTTCGQGVCVHTVANCQAGATQVCNPNEGAGQELCDSADNDCDGQTDEDLGTTTCGQGQCLHTVANCQFGVTQSCNAQQGATGEVCDGADNDCDGQTDESNPGGGGTCAVPGKQGVCASGVLECAFGSLSCKQTSFGGGETCNGLDDNCNGQTDELNPGGGGSCTVPGGKGVCAAGTMQCQGGGLTCVANQGPSSESCNGLDDDCDGTTDDGNPGGGGSCSVAGKQGVCAQGQLQCTNGQLQCAQQNWPSAESCDGQDNDCNGQVDGFTQGCSATCGAGNQTCNWGSWTPCTGAGQVCSPSDPCCQSSGCGYEQAYVQCSASPYSTQYQCTSGTGCGGSAQKKETFRHCTGYSSSCGTSNLQQGSWQTIDSCSSNERCISSGGSATCQGCPSGQSCTNGSCVSQCSDVFIDASQASVYNAGNIDWSVTSSCLDQWTDCGWHSGTGANGINIRWAWTSNCSLPSTANPTSYPLDNARWTFTVAATGIYDVEAKIPAEGYVCTLNGQAPSNRYASDVHYGLKRSGETGVISSGWNTASYKGAWMKVFNNVHLNAGTHTLVLYDHGSTGTGCSCAGASSRFVFVDSVRVVCQ